MVCQNYQCENKTKGYDMYCENCQKKWIIYNKFLKMDNKRNEIIKKEFTLKQLINILNGLQYLRKNKVFENRMIERKLYLLWKNIKNN